MGSHVKGLAAALALVALGGCASLEEQGFLASVEPGAGPIGAIDPATGLIEDETARAVMSAVVVGDLLVGGQVGTQLAQAASTSVMPAAGPDDGPVSPYEEEGPILLYQEVDEDTPDRAARRAAAFERFIVQRERQRLIEADKALHFEG